MKLRIAKRAQQQAAKMAEWWALHRGSADGFANELEATFQHLCEQRGAGVRWPTVRRPSLRRILMPWSKNHVYFLIDEPTETVHVIAIWGAPRGSTPKL